MNSNNQNTEFDKYSDKYKKLLKGSFPKFFQDIDYYSEYKIKEVFNHRKKIQTHAILDFGCGVGLSLKFFSEYFSGVKLWGYDNSSLSLKEVKDNNSLLNLTNNLNDIPSDYFDVIFIANVFHHIEEREHEKTLNNIKKYLKDDGLIYIFEHNRLNPLTKIIFSMSELDKNAKMVPIKRFYELANKCGMNIVLKKYTLFFPKILSFLQFLENLLNWIPLGMQYLIVIKKKGQ